MAMILQEKIKFLLLIPILIFFPAKILAQKKQVSSIQWEIAGELPSLTRQEKALGLAGPVVGVHRDVLIIGGGANFPDGMPWMGGKKKYYNDLYAFRKDDRGKIISTGKTFHLPFNTAYGASCTTPQGIVYAGGENGSEISRKALLIGWNAAEDVFIQQLPDLPYPVSGAVIAFSGSTVYIAGGKSTDGISNKMVSLDLDNLPAGWNSMPPLPKPVFHAVMVVQSNGDHPCIYLAGGRKSNDHGISDLYASVYSFDLKENTWSPKSQLPNSLTAGSGIAMGASYILLFGGDQGEIFHKIEKLAVEIANEKNVEVKDRLIQQINQLQISHPGFSKEVLLYNTITDVWTVADSIPFDTQVTTTAVRWGDDIVIPTGEIKPGVRTPRIIRGSISKKEFLSWPDTFVLAACFLLMTVARYFFTSHKTTTADYFKGGQKIPQWAAGISIFGAKLSAITFMGIPAKTYGTNWTYFFMLMTIIMIMPVVVKFFIPFYRRLNVTSAYEYLEKRFNYGCRLAASLLYILLQLGRMGIVVLLPSIALTLVTGINVNLCILLIGAISIFFTVKGGIEAVIWVEVVQVSILAGGALLCLFYIPFHLNDVDAAVESIRHYDKLKVFDFRFDFSEPTLWVVVIGGLAISLVTYGTDQTTVQRYLTTHTEKESIKSLKIGAWLTLPSAFLFFSLGTLLFLFFREQPGQVNFSLNNQDNIFPWFIVSQLPVGLSGLLIAGIFAAAMSSTEASMNSVATLLTADFYKKFRPEVSEKQTLFFARMATLLLGLFVTGIALYMSQQGVSSLWDKFNTILGLFTGCIGGAFLLGIFTRRANGPGVLAGMIISSVTQVLIQNYTSIHLLMYAFTGLLSCVVSGYLFSLLFTAKKPIAGLTYSTLKSIPEPALK